jgi:hypothetical protein
MSRLKTFCTSSRSEQDVEQLEEAFAALMSAGISYIEDSVT